MNNNQKALKTIAKGVSLLLVGMFLSKFFMYLYRIIVARYLGPSSYGLISLSLAVIGLITLFSLLGLPQGIVRYISYYRGKNDNKSINGVIFFTFLLTVPLSIILTILCFFFSESISITFFHKAELSPILRIFVLSIPFLVIISNTEKILLAFQKIKYIVISRNIIENASKVILALFFILMGASVIGVSIAYLVAISLSTMVLLYFLHIKTYSFWNVFKDRIAVYRDLIRFSAPLLFNEIFANLLVWTDTLILGYLVSSALIGVYNAAVPTALLVYIFPTTFRTVFYPMISETYAQKKDYKMLCNSVNKWIFFLTLPILCLLIIFSRNILNIFFGGAYTQGYLVLIVIASSYLIYSTAAVSHSLLFLFKKTKHVFFNTIFSFGVNITLNLLLIPKYGILGAAIATGSSLLLRTLLISVEAFYFTKIIPFRPNFFKSILGSVIASAVILLILQYLPINLLMLILYGIIFLVVYILVLLLLKSFEKDDIMIIIMIQNKLKLNWLNKWIRK